MSDLCKLLEKITDGSATAAEEAAHDEHAQECSACARELAWQRRERELFSARKARAVAPLWKDIEARIAAPAPRRQASWVAGSVAAAAALLLLVKSVPMAPHHDVPPTPIVVMPAQGAALPVKPVTLVTPEPASVQSWKLTLEGVARIAVSDGDGTVTVRPTTENALHVIASANDDLEGWKARVDRIGKDVSVRVECVHSCGDKPSVDFVVEVPRSAPKVVVDTISADVVVDHVGSVSVHSVSGDVHVTGAGLDRVRTTSGDIDIADAPSAALELESISGDVKWAGRCDEGCNIHVQTVSGDVHLDPVPGSAFDTAFAFADARRSVRKRGGPGRIVVGTVSGDVEVSGVDVSDDDDSTNPSLPFVAAGHVESTSSGLVVNVDLDEAQRANVDVGQRVRVTSDSQPGVSVTGVLTSIGEEDDRRGVTPVTVTLPKDSLLPRTSALCQFGEMAEPEDLVAVGSPSGGLVKEVTVHVGDEVQKGQVVVRLDASAAEAELTAVRLEAAEYERAYGQMESLFKAGAATVVQVSQAKSALALAKAKARVPEQRIAMASVRALVPGYVREVLVHPGETVPANGRVILVAKTKK